VISNAIAFAERNILVRGDDGGAWATTDRGESWTIRNEEPSTLEFL